MVKFKTFRFKWEEGGGVIEFKVSKLSIGIIVLKTIEETIVKFKIKILVEYSFHFN